MLTVREAVSNMVLEVPRLAHQHQIVGKLPNVKMMSSAMKTRNVNHQTYQMFNVEQTMTVQYWIRISQFVKLLEMIRNVWDLRTARHSVLTNKYAVQMINVKHLVSDIYEKYQIIFTMYRLEVEGHFGPSF